MRQRVQMLSDYISWFEESDVPVIGGQTRISLKITDELTIGGQLARVDLTRRGYRGVILNNSRPIGWESQKNWPILQLGLSQVIERPIAEISIGYQSLDGRNIQTQVFSELEIDAVVNDLRSASAEIERLATLPEFQVP